MESIFALLYLVAAVCFIMALRGLSSPETARSGNIFGISGMVIAILTTLALTQVVSYWLIGVGILVGGAVGTFIALRIQMTALPQLVAAFHSLVGLAAVFVAAAAFFNPEAYGIGEYGNIAIGSLIEMSIGTAIGAITFTGSVVAFAKLQGLVSGKPLVFIGQHPLNAVLAILTIALVWWLCQGQSAIAFWLIVVIALALGFLLILPIGGADMPVVISMLNSYSGWAACGIGFTLQNNLLIITGALVGSSGAILSYIMCKGMNRSIFNVILGGFGGETAAAAWRRWRRQDGQARQRRRRLLHHGQCPVGDHRARLRHGGRPGAARPARNVRPAEERGRRRQIRHPSGCRPHAGGI